MPSLKEIVLGKYGGLTKGELKKMTHRSKFSDYLPYIAYDPETKIYLNIDNTIGAMWDCTPLSFAGEKTLNTLGGLFRIAFPEMTVLSFTLYADDYIDPFIDAHNSLMVRDHPLIKKSAASAKALFEQGKQGLKQMSGTPLRNFRLFVSVKMPADASGLNPQDLMRDVEEILFGANLYPQAFEPEMLLDAGRRLFNAEASLNNNLYDDTIPIRKQMIFSDTSVHTESSYIQIADKYFKCLTPKLFPKKVDLMQTNKLFGGIDGIISDTEQFKTPFLYTLNVIFQNLKTKLHTKCNLVLHQQAMGSFAPSLMRKKEEYMWAADAVEAHTKFLRVMPILWVWSKDLDATKESMVRAKRIWEGQGYQMQEDRHILPILFISALPFGLYTEGNNLTSIDRDFITSADSAAAILPVQADFAGGGKPVTIFEGRKGQCCGTDMFEKKAPSHNFVIIAKTGVGKSFLVNYITTKHYGTNAIIRIIDIGGSYKETTRKFGARYLDFREDSNICINPFTYIDSSDKDEVDISLSAISAIVLQMAYSSTDIIPEEHAESAAKLVEQAVGWAWETKKNDAEIDTVFEYLNTFPKYAVGHDFGCEGKEKCAENLTTISYTLAFYIKDFTSTGRYGRWFNGRSNFDISKDEFVVLELEHLKAKKTLFGVVTLQILNAVTQDLYMSDRSRPRFIVFDEAWQFLRTMEGDTYGFMRHVKDVIESGYRRSRKHMGSFGTVFQSPLDIAQFGAVGRVMMGNSAFKYFLESEDYEKALQEKIIDYDPFTMYQLKNIKSRKGEYSEIFMDIPFGVGVTRLIVDDYSYYLYTSDANEKTEIAALQESGMTYDQAIEEMVRRHRS